ncbi:FadR/GntR family transcriptional regulator [Nocardiopsis coralliicola]
MTTDHDPAHPRTSVARRAIEQVKEMIASGSLRPGQRLPTEREFAAQLGLSRSSMREAISALAVLGIVEIRHGSGAYVSSLSPRDLLEALGSVAEVSSGATLVELMEVRRLLEGHAAAAAAARIGAAGLAEVRAHLDRMERGGPVEEMIAADHDFHQAIAEASGNAALAAILAGLSSRTFGARVWRGHRAAEVMQRLHAEHQRIYDALEGRDPGAAEAAAAAHVLEVEGWLRQRGAAGQGTGLPAEAAGGGTPDPPDGPAAVPDAGPPGPAADAVAD